MDIEGFVQAIEDDPALRRHVAKRHYVPAVRPDYASLDLDPGLRKVLKAGCIESFYSHQAKALYIFPQRASNSTSSRPLSGLPTEPTADVNAMKTLDI